MKKRIIACNQTKKRYAWRSVKATPGLVFVLTACLICIAFAAWYGNVRQKSGVPSILMFYTDEEDLFILDRDILLRYDIDDNSFSKILNGKNIDVHYIDREYIIYSNEKELIARNRDTGDEKTLVKFSDVLFTENMNSRTDISYVYLDEFVRQESENADRAIYFTLDSGYDQYSDEEHHFPTGVMGVIMLYRYDMKNSLLYPIQEYRYANSRVDGTYVKPGSGERIKEDDEIHKILYVIDDYIYFINGEGTVMRTNRKRTGAEKVYESKDKDMMNYITYRNKSGFAYFASNGTEPGPFPWIDDTGIFLKRTEIISVDWNGNAKSLGEIKDEDFGGYDKRCYYYDEEKERYLYITINGEVKSAAFGNENDEADISTIAVFERVNRYGPPKVIEVKGHVFVSRANRYHDTNYSVFDIDPSGKKSEIMTGK